MTVEQIYTGCLSQGAYYIESNGEVAIIDPLREVQPYIDKTEAAGGKIKYIFETHFHADFVSGHVTLSEKTGEAFAQITSEVGELANLNTQIATAIEEQSLVSEEINRNVVAINQVAQETAERSRETVASNQQLATLADNVLGLVRQFKV